MPSPSVLPRRCAASSFVYAWLARTCFMANAQASVDPDELAENYRKMHTGALGAEITHPAIAV